MTEPQCIAILGGTGRQGSGLARRWACAGHRVLVGSRDGDRARRAAEGLNAELPERCARILGASNRDAARDAVVVVLAVPYAAQLAAADEVKDLLAGKILVDVTVPLVPPRVERVQLPAGGSAVEILQHRLGRAVRVVSAFQNVSASHLRHIERVVECEVLVCGDDPEAREAVVVLARAAGLTAWHAGPLANSAAAEALTSVLVAINRHYKAAGSGIRITGVPGGTDGYVR